MIRGIPVERYTRFEAVAAYWAIGLHLGVPICQNGRGHMLGHVKDLGGNLANPKHRGHHTRAHLPFHCDGCDIVGLLCLRTSKSGGQSVVASSIAIYNEMVRWRPDLAAELARRIYRDRREEIPEGKLPYYALPVFNFYRDLLTVHYQGTYIRSAQRFPELPRHSPLLVEALDMFNALANELSFEMEFLPGDIQLLHSHVTVHSRTEYEDWPEEDKRRHLLRLWLATPGGRPLSPAFGERYNAMAHGERPVGGVIVPGVEFKLPLEAE